MAALPPEIVTEILSRLPVKPLLCFRCVSKQWLGLIDSPRFIKLHLKSSFETRNNRNLIIKYGDSSTHSINLDSDSLDPAVVPNPCKRDGGYRFDVSVSFRVWGSCNGLILLSYEDGEDDEDINLVIWNPFTRKFRQLPRIVDSKSKYRFLEFGDLETHGIGYDSVHDDYKVVSLFQYKGNPSTTPFYSEVMVYSLNSNTWYRIQDFRYYICDHWIHGALCGGALHWVVSDNVDGERPFVAAFDLASEEYRLVPMPKIVCKDYCMSVSALDGHLCIFMTYDNKASEDVWVMQNYGIKESWTKVLTVNPPKDGYDVLLPLAFSKDSTKVLLVQDYHTLKAYCESKVEIVGDSIKLIWYDLGRKVGNNIDVRALHRRFRVEFAVQSLVPLGSGSKTIGNKLCSEYKKEKAKRIGKKRHGGSTSKNNA